MTPGFQQDKIRGGYLQVKMGREKVLGKAAGRKLAHQGKGKQFCLTVKRDERD